MLRRLASLRFWLVAAMTGVAILGLIAARFLIVGIQRSDELAKDRRKAEIVAASIATEIRGPNPHARLRTMQAVLPTDQILVYRGGRLLFAGAPRHRGDFELSVTKPIPGGRVVLRDYESPAGPTSAWTVTLITASVVLLVILAAVATATVLVRAVRSPVERAVAAARRVAAGDFSARIGSGGPEELGELGRSFDEMASRLEAAERDQRRFLADVAHEIATPLNVISGYAIALADNHIRDPEEIEEISAVVHGETERLRALLANLRELTQLDLAQPGPLEEVDVGELFGQLETRFGPAARQAKVGLQVRGGGSVQSNPRLLTTVLDNLLSNALRYTPAGGEVRLTSHRRRQELVLSVRDTGIGIDPADQSRIFDRFYRVDKARDRASGGSGIGLALAQRAARALGGRIELQSTPGQGSEFSLIIPRTAKQPTAATPSSRMSAS